MEGIGSKRLRGSGWRVLIGTFVGPFVQVAVLFLAAGHMDIALVWWFVLVSWVGMFGGIMVVWAINPELINVRGDRKKMKRAKLWDKFLLPVYGIVGFYVSVAIIGLDVGRFGWSDLGAAAAVVGSVLFMAGSVIIHWAMIVNRHFEPSVRIQTDRGHKVVTGGPYGIVRHPGYVGAALWNIATPLMLGSLYGLIPAAAAVVALIVRTFLEDKMLHRELDGYSDYAKKVRSRLVPGLW